MRYDKGNVKGMKKIGEKSIDLGGKKVKLEKYDSRVNQ